MQERVLIVDFSHQVHIFYHSKFRMSVNVVVNGEVVQKDTTVQNSAIKNLNRWSKGGIFPTAVCFDRPVPARKAFWQGVFPEMAVGSGNEYKGNRESMPDAMFEAVTDCENILRRAGVSCYARANYEADDLIFACVQRAKEKYPGSPIDIVTNDADLLPLVDNQVSVFLRSKKLTWAEDKSLEKAHYVQVTPKNFQSVVEDLSAYRGFLIPYNTLLLHKLLRGDSSDNFRMKEISRMFPKSKYNAMIMKMIEDDINFNEIFRYGKPIYEIYNTVTGEVFSGSLQEALASPERKNLKKRICDSDELDAITKILHMYTVLSDEQIDVVRNVYLGMNLNQPYANSDDRLKRKEYKITAESSSTPDICRYNQVALHEAVLPLGIHLQLS